MRVVTDAQPQAQSLEVIAQDVFFLGGWAFVHPKQPRVLALLNEVGAAHVRCQHRLFNQAVSLVAHTGYDLFNPAALVAYDLRFGGLEVHRTTHRARCQQGFVNVLQVHQVGHALFALGGFRPAGVGQNRRHFGVSETRMAVHDRRVELVGMHVALGIDQHVTDHAQTVDIGVQ